MLLIGVPLLALVDGATARSVIAHELGHFSHRLWASLAAIDPEASPKKGEDRG